MSATGDRGGRRWWQRLLATGLGSVLAVGALGTGASVADEGEGDDGEDEGDDATTTEVESQSEHGELERCVADFGVGKTLVVFDDPEFDPEQADVDLALTGAADGCEIVQSFVDFIDYEDLVGFIGEPEGVPSYDGVEHFAVVGYGVAEQRDFQLSSADEGTVAAADLDDLGIAVTVDWNVRDQVPLSFGPVDRPLCDAELDLECREDDVLAEMLANPVVLSPFVDLGLATSWSDADGEGIDAPAEGWDASLLFGDAELLTLPGDEGGVAELIRTQTYAVAASAPDGFEEVTCEVSPSGTGGTFTAEADATHQVCFQQIAVAAEETGETEETVVEEDEEVEAELVVAAPTTDELPATGVPLGLTLLGTGLLAAGGVTVRRTSPRRD